MEDYRVVFKPYEDVTLRPFQSYSISFDYNVVADNAYRLFFTGETAMFCCWKDEPNYQYLYRRLDDALSTDAYKAQYCLKLAGMEYPKKVYTKLLWKPKLSCKLNLHSYTDEWQGGVYAKAENITVQENGYLHMRFEVRYLKDGISRHSIAEKPDKVFTFDFPSGTYDWQEISLPIHVPTKETASVCVWVEGEHYDGTLFIERPFLISSNGHNILQDFSTNAPNRPQFNWLGQNLSCKECPEFEVSLNDSVFYSGEIFERSHRYSESELPIPNDLLKQGKNELSFKLISNYRDALPYNIYEVGIVSEPNGDFEIIACPEQVVVSERFSVLIKNNSSKSLKLKPKDIRVQVLSPLDVLAKGLNVLTFQCDEPANNVQFILSNGITERICTIKRVVVRQEDHVFTGTGDMTYINQKLDASMNYLCWYMANWKLYSSRGPKKIPFLI